ncbi:MAG TPA: helix-turn-helix domain-containing protein [Candidatus Krumholzibacteria bacterium]|nr:helix-turn-helix domain-containing protein [Candidatus Krumholzibacteria bacterium]
MRRLRAAVAECGRPPLQIAADARITGPYLDELLAGKRTRVPPHVLDDLARALGNQPQWIISGSLADSATIGARIRRLRIERHLSQQSLVDAMEEIDPGTAIGKGNLQRIERGMIRRPHDATLHLISKVLGVTREYLLQGAIVPPGTTEQPSPIPAPPAPLRPSRRAVPVAAVVAAAVVLAVTAYVWTQWRAHRADRGYEVVETHDDRTLELHAPDGTLLWSRDFKSRIYEHRDNFSWDGTRAIVVGLDDSAPDQAGALLVYRASDGKPLLEDWRDPEDRKELIQFAGDRGRDYQLLMKRYFGTQLAEPLGDIDGDGHPELVIATQTRNPGCAGRLRVYSAKGAILGSYYFAGDIDYHEIDDIDGDGRDEIIVTGTSGDPRHAGFTLAVLDDHHLSGVAPDARENPNCTLTGEALAAVRFPALDEVFMRAWGGSQLHGWEIVILPPGTRERIMVACSPDPDRGLFVYLDGALNPVRVEIPDATRAEIANWPAATRERFENGYLNEWLARAEHFGAPRVDG